jgi:hypothetical protein
MAPGPGLAQPVRQLVTPKGPNGMTGKWRLERVEVEESEPTSSKVHPTRWMPLCAFFTTRMAWVRARVTYSRSASEA